MGEERQTRLQRAIAAIQAHWGTHALQTGNGNTNAPVAVISTGFADLDTALALEGIPCGALTELLGTPTSGVTSLAYSITAQAQRGAGVVAYIDLARSFDPLAAASCGIDLDALLLVRSEQPRDVFGIIEELLRADASLIVVDQLSYLQVVPEHASLLARALDRFRTQFVHSSTALLAVTVLPYPPAVVAHIGYRGSSVAQRSDLRLHLQLSHWLDDDTGYGAMVTILRHKLSPAVVGTSCTLEFQFAQHQVGM